MDEKNVASEGDVAAWLVDAMTSMFESPAVAERLLEDVRRNRFGEPLPLRHADVRRMLWHELAPAASGLLGVGASALAVELELQLEVLAPIADEPPAPSIRVVTTCRTQAMADHVGSLLGASEVCWAPELWQLLVALESDERTILVHDVGGSDLDVGLLARLVPDFAPNVVTFVAGAGEATRALFIQTGAAFRATLGPDPIEHPSATELLCDIARKTMPAPVSSRAREDRTTMTQLRTA